MTEGVWVRWHDKSGRLCVGRFMNYTDESQEYARIQYREYLGWNKRGPAHPVTVPTAELRQFSKPPVPKEVWEANTEQATRPDVLDKAAS